ncbi:ROK family transcriptional regulator [Egicoccus halophilus]|uniref:Sugar kinase n=1 Tax=Egicoccus halophilus TaxID=1670830 RepID=A0A8J3EWE0_9ACTN|nr:ROK family transcriptional regulator [Egicoccus halophilus]GGI03445.1 sugar kinase [Egicoccus halophilus]
MAVGRDRAGRRTPGSPGELLSLIVDGRASTRTALAEATGLSRSTIAQRLEPLMAGGLVREVETGVSTGGRPPMALRFNHEAGMLLVADVGATLVRAAVTDLAGGVLARRVHDLDVADGPEPVLGEVLACFDALLEEVGRPDADVRGIGLGVPGPVEFARGVAVSPPIMPGWNEFPIRDHLARRYDVPVLVDNDVNIMALGEYGQIWGDRVRDLLFVKVGTGIGAGIVVDGHIRRGAQGAAGDIGHIRVAGAEEVLCPCSNVGCLEAVAGGGALARELRALGRPAQRPADVVELVRQGDADAVSLVRDAGRQLGVVLAGLVNLLNPAVIVVGGRMATVDEQLLAGVRESIYSRSLPLATRSLQIVRSQLGEDAGITGATNLVLDHLLTPAAVDAQLAAGRTVAVG